VDRSGLRLGAGHLGSPPKASGSLGSRPLGASSRRLGLDRRPLAVRSRLIGCQVLEPITTNRLPFAERHQPRTLAKSRGATIVASDSMMNFGVSMFNLPHVIFSLGTAPEYDPKLVVESLI
jgi:hypothetical protein